MRYYQKHRLKIFAKWVGDMSCLPYYITPAIWYEKYHYHNGQSWNLHMKWLGFRGWIRLVTKGCLIKNH